MEAEVTKEATKICSKCAGEKELTEYTKHAHSKDGLDTVCKVCRSVYRTTGKGRALKALHNAQRRRQEAETKLGEPIRDSLKVYEVGFLQGERECAYCGDDLAESTIVLDHVIPLSQGGANEYVNLVACCKTCNSRKSDKTFIEFLRVYCDKQTERKFLFMLAQRYGVDISDLLK